MRLNRKQGNQIRIAIKIHTSEEDLKALVQVKVRNFEKSCNKTNVFFFLLTDSHKPNPEAQDEEMFIAANGNLDSCIS